MGMDVSIIVPAYNEAQSVGRLYDLIVQHMEPTGLGFEVIFVDDGSSDNTFESLRDLAGRDDRVIAVQLRRNYGQTPAMTAGIDIARGRILVTMDADLQNDPADIPTLIAKMSEGYDLVVGYRIRRQDKFLTRKLPSMIANWLIGKVTGLPIRDNGCSLKAYRASVIKRVPLYSDMHRFIPAMATPVGASIAQVGVRHHARQFGASKYGLSRVYKVLIDLITIKAVLLFAARPLTWFTGGSVVAVLIAALAGALAVERMGIPNADPTLVLSSVALLFGSLAIFLMSAGFVVALAHIRGFGASSDPASTA